MTGASRPTAIRDLAELVAKRVFLRHGAARSAHYTVAENRLKNDSNDSPGRGLGNDSKMTQMTHQPPPRPPQQMPRLAIAPRPRRMRHPPSPSGNGTLRGHPSKPVINTTTPTNRTPLNLPPLGPLGNERASGRGNPNVNRFTRICSCSIGQFLYPSNRFGVFMPDILSQLAIPAAESVSFRATYPQQKQ